MIIHKQYIKMLDSDKLKEADCTFINHYLSRRLGGVMPNRIEPITGNKKL